MRDYTQQWLVYRRLRNQALVVSLLLFPLFGGLFFMTFLLHGLHFPDYLATGLLLGWFAAAYITGVRANCFLCPRCGEYFAFKWWYHGSMLFARRCAHCGLAKYATHDPPS
jgi:hypothetical protein